MTVWFRDLPRCLFSFSRASASYPGNLAICSRREGGWSGRMTACGRKPLPTPATSVAIHQPFPDLFHAYHRLNVPESARDKHTYSAA